MNFVGIYWIFFLYYIIIMENADVKDIFSASKTVIEFLTIVTLL